MKVTGAEFMDWFDNHWPGEDWYIDDGAIETHGIGDRWLLDPAAVYNTDDFGSLFYQGEDESKRFDRLDIDSLIQKYREQRDSDVLVVTIPKNLTEELRFLLKQYGCTVK